MTMKPSTPMKRATTITGATFANLAFHDSIDQLDGIFVVSRMLYLAVVLNSYAEINDDLEEFLENADYEGLAADLDVRNLEDIEDYRERLEMFVEYCTFHKRYGFLCKVEAPETIRQGRAKEPHLGIRKIRWFYDDSLDHLIDRANEWAISLEKSQ